MKKLIFIITICMSLAFTACGAEEETQNVVQEELVDYTVSKSSVKLADISYIEAWCDTPQQLVYIGTRINAKEDVKLLFLVDKESLTDKKDADEVLGVELPMDTGERASVIFPGSDESICVISTTFHEGGRSFFLNTFEKDGTFVSDKEITNVCGETFDLKGETYLKCAAMDEAGRVYVLYYGQENGVMVLNDTGELLKNISCEDGAFLDMQKTGDEVYLILRFEDVRKKEMLLHIEKDNMKLSEDAEIPDGRGCTSLGATGESTLWISDYEGIWKYSPSEKNVTKIYVWMEAGKEGKDIADIVVCADESVAAISKNQTVPGKHSFIYLHEEQGNSGEGKEEKITITLGVLGNPDTLLQKTIQQFNASDTEYCVEIKSYDSDRFLTELMAGKGPDLIPIKSIAIELYAEKGITEDLIPYLEGSQRVHREDIFKKVMELYTAENKLVAIPPTFQINAPIGRASELGTEAGWTTEEFLYYVENNRGATVYEGSSRGDSGAYIISNYVHAEWDNLVDFEKKKANFDTEDFREILEYAKAYEAVHDLGTENFDIEERFREGKILLYDNLLRTWSSYMQYKEALGGDVVVIGYPSASGEVRYGMSTSYAYGIYTKSENKEGAWAFIEYLLLVQEEEVKDTKSLWNFGFSTYLPALEYQYNKAIEAAGYYRGQELDKDIQERKRQEINMTREIMEQVSFLLGNGHQVKFIVDEECLIYLNEGESYTAEKAAEIIQNRVQLYLDEMDN